MCTAAASTPGYGNNEPAWIDDPNVLLRSADIFPVERQSETQRLNAVTRLLAAVTITVFAITRSMGTLILGIVCAIGLAFLYSMAPQTLRRDNITSARSTKKKCSTNCRSRPAACACGSSSDAAAAYTDSDTADSAAACKRRAPNEGFVAAANDIVHSAAAAEPDDPSFLESVKAAIENRDGLYQAPTAINPFGNLLETDALLRPGRRPAPPLNTPEAREAVYAAMEAQVKALHPGEAARLFANSADQMQFRQSLRPFFSNPSSTVIPDSGAAWKFMAPNTAAWRDGVCRPGSKWRPRYKAGGSSKESMRTGKQSNFQNTADILEPVVVSAK